MHSSIQHLYTTSVTYDSFLHPVKVYFPSIFTFWFNIKNRSKIIHQLSILSFSYLFFRIRRIFFSFLSTGYLFSTFSSSFPLYLRLPYLLLCNKSHGLNLVKEGEQRNLFYGGNSIFNILYIFLILIALSLWKLSYIDMKSNSQILQETNNKSPVCSDPKSYKFCWLSSP